MLARIVPLFTQPTDRRLIVAHETSRTASQLREDIAVVGAVFDAEVVVGNRTADQTAHALIVVVVLAAAVLTDGIVLYRSVVGRVGDHRAVLFGRTAAQRADQTAAASWERLFLPLLVQ